MRFLDSAAVKRVFHFSFLRQSVESAGRKAATYTQTQNKRTQTSMAWVGFEPTILVFKREKTFHTLDRVATVIGDMMINEW
jgi:hypothetical protein